MNTALERMSEKCQCVGKSVIIIGHLNVDFLKESMPLAEFLDVYGMQNIVQGPTCFKSTSNPTSVDVIITDSWRRISKCINISNGISDFHSIVCAATKMHAPQTQPRRIVYWSYKVFTEAGFINDLNHAKNSLFSNIVNAHGPLKQKS